MIAIPRARRTEQQQPVGRRQLPSADPRYTPTLTLYRGTPARWRWRRLTVEGLALHRPPEEPHHRPDDSLPIDTTSQRESGLRERIDAMF